MLMLLRVQPEDAKKIQLRHFLYELERGLFGPTFELIMQYEDFTRTDIAVKLQAKGPIKAREGDGESRRMKQGRSCKTGYTQRCPQRHEMVTMTG